MISAAIHAAGSFLSHAFSTQDRGYDVDDQLTERDNPAVGIALFGFLGGFSASLGHCLRPIQSQILKRPMLQT